VADRLTLAERNVVQLLADAWNAYALLPIEHPMDQDEFCRAVHVLQDKVLARPGRRDLNAPGVKDATAPRRPTDDELRAWIDRHDLGGISLTDARCVFEDAQTLHLADGVLGTSNDQQEQRNV
jgi:hypothetical protein